ncbi:MAG: phasin family protein [Rudaea sp.]
MIAVPRQFWLASLGAAAVTREWAAKDARPMFRALVKEGAAVESAALRRAGQRVDVSMERATTLVHDVRNGVTSSARMLAGIASSLTRRFPAVHARVDVESPAAPKRATKARRGRKAATARRRTAKSGTAR